MRIMKKHCTLADFEFDISIDRNMVGEIFDSCPYILDVMDEMSESYNKKEEQSEEMEEENALSIAKRVKMKSVMNFRDKVEEVVAFALPLMLQKAGESKELAKKILDIADKHNLDRVYDGFWEFIMEAFTSSESEEAKAIVFKME